MSAKVNESLGEKLDRIELRRLKRERLKLERLFPEDVIYKYSKYAEVIERIAELERR